jgi:hypothetical protein
MINFLIKMRGTKRPGNTFFSDIVNDNVTLVLRLALRISSTCFIKHVI